MTPPMGAPDTPPGLVRRTVFLLAPYAAFLLLLLLVEAGARWLLPTVDTLDFLVAAPRQRDAFTDRQHVNIFEGDALRFWRLRPNVHDVIWDLTLVSTNPQGLRHDRPLTAKPPGRFRVVCLGDSVTFGYRIPRVAPRSPADYDPRWLPYPRLLEEKLRGRHPGRDVEVVAMAVPGYTSHQGLAWFRQEERRLDADLVTVCYGWNDINRLGATDAAAMDTRPVPLLMRRAVLRSQALMHAGRRLRSVPSSPTAEVGPPPMRVPLAAYVANQLEIARLAAAGGAAVVFIGPVYRDRVSHPPEGDEIAAHRAALRETASRHGIPYLEIPELTEDAAPENTSLFEEHIHPNHKGHRLMADRLYAFLEVHHLLPPEVGPGR